MNVSHLLLHYGELSTKGLNKKAFIQRLVQNVNRALKDPFPDLKARGDNAHAYVPVEEGTDLGALLSLLLKIPGIQRVTPVLRSGRSLEELQEAALKAIEGEEFKTFKVEVRRPDHSYPMSGYEVARTLGGTILRARKGAKVDVHNPERTLLVEIREKECYLSCRTYKGAGGYPVGSGGRALMLLSGGIDSPVASYLLMRRGLVLDFLHFAAPPYTSEAVLEKLADILDVLAPYQGKVHLHVVPFTKVQLSIYSHAAEPYCITLLRRMMMRIASEFAERKGFPALATGESLGQVASQTVESLRAINEVTSLPVLRPCLAMDKTDILRLSKELGTYEISIRPYEDCCTIFKPKKPKTRPKREECRFFEGKWEFMKEIQEAVDGIASYKVEEGRLVPLGKEKTE